MWCQFRFAIFMQQFGGVLSVRLVVRQERTEVKHFLQVNHCQWLMHNLLMNACVMQSVVPFCKFKAYQGLHCKQTNRKSKVLTPVRKVPLCKVTLFSRSRLSIGNFSKAFCLQITMTFQCKEPPDSLRSRSFQSKHLSSHRRPLGFTPIAGMLTADGELHWILGEVTRQVSGNP